MALDPALKSRFTSQKNKATAGAPATDTAPAPDVSADTKPAAVRKSRAKPAAAQAEAPADAAASSDDMTKTIVIPGEHGPISITGDARDLCDVSTALNHS